MGRGAVTVTRRTPSKPGRITSRATRCEALRCRRRFVKRLMAFLGVLSLGLVLASAAGAATVAPTTAERAAIIKAFGDPPAAGSCLIVALAASNHAYGDVRPRLTQTCGRWAFNGTNVLKRAAGGRWSV